MGLDPARWSRRRAGGLAAGLLLLAACAPGPGGRGEAGQKTGAGAHPRILSLNPCTDAILAEVADRGQIAGLSVFSGDPAQSSMDVGLARSLPVSGGTLEEALAAHPDVVLAGGFVSPASRAAYARLGLPLKTFGVAGSVGESEAQVRAIAALAGHRERGEALVGRIEAALRAAAPSAGEPISALVWQGGGMVPGRGALITELLARTGFESFSARQGMGQADVLPLERLLAKPPGVILVARDGGGDGVLAGPGEDRMLSHPALERLTGVRRFGFAPRYEWCGGPTIIGAVRALAKVRADLARGRGA